jgi:uncharacterized membrane protein YvlD (DUF360 family)
MALQAAHPTTGLLVIRLLATAAVALIANAVGLIVGALVIPDMSIDGVAFVIAVVIFTGAGLLIEPFIRQMAARKARALVGSSSLVATLVALVLTKIFSDGLQIRGLGTWVMATVVVWAVALLARFLLPFVMFKKVLTNRSDND